MKFRFRLFPITIFAAALLLSVRVGEMWQQISIEVGGQSAAEASPTGTKAAAGMETKPADRKAPKAKESAKGGSNKPSMNAENSAENFDPDSLSDSELTVLQELASRREELDQRERNIEMRSGLLKAAEKRVEEKIAELKAIQAKIQSELKKRDDEHEAQMQSLVKIYEKMKPKDAARIFGQLDIDILLDVVDRMKEAKSAPILAAMNPSKAKEVTVELARRKDASKADKKKIADGDDAGR